jgi:serine protease Do
MNIAPNSNPRTRKRLLAAAASVAIAGAIGFGAVATGTAPVLAEAVRVEAPQVPSFADVVERVSPAVVSVRVKAKIKTTADDGSDPPDAFGNLPDDPQLRRFFREFRGFGDQDGRDGMRRFGRRDRQPRPVAQGSGFFISEDGYLVTNNHVVGDGSSFPVVMHDGKELDAKLVGTDPRTDLAVLKVEGDGKFTYVDFADDSKVRVGDWVVAVGNPFGLGGTVTAGIVSARGRDIGAGPYDDFIQIDAAVNRGNSGGPAFNLKGEVVGINTAIERDQPGVGFAVPINRAKRFLPDMLAGQTVRHPWLGISGVDVTPFLADQHGLAAQRGVLLADVVPGSPAAQAGLRSAEGSPSNADLILAADGRNVSTIADLVGYADSRRVGDKIILSILRGGQALDLQLVLGEFPAELLERR